MKIFRALLAALVVTAASTASAQSDTGRPLPEAVKAQLRGSWIGELSAGETTLAIAYQFKDDRYGELEGFLDSPDQGVIGVRIRNIVADLNTLSFDVPMLSAQYSATLNADGMAGTFTQRDQTFPLNMTRGRYLQHDLELSQEAIGRLEGSWVGRVQDPVDGPLNMVLRFEAQAEDKLVAFLDSPDQGESDIPVTAVSLDGDALSLAVSYRLTTYAATLSANELAGTWIQEDNAQTVTMTRGEYVPPAAASNLSDETCERLAGTRDSRSPRLCSMVMRSA